MKSKIIIMSLFLLLRSVPCFPDSAYQTLFEEAQSAYQKGDFKTSLKKFLKLSRPDTPVPETYYNIANCYYKLGKIGKAVLFYERAHRLQKRDDDIRANLLIVKKQIKDRWEKNPQSLLKTILSPITGNFSVWELTLMVVVFLWIFFILFSLSLSGKKSKFVRIFFISLVPFFFLFTASLMTSLYENHSSLAILTKQTVTVRSGPDASFPVAMTLHEGTALKIIDQNGDWSKAVFPDQTIGWLKSKTYEFIQENTKI